MFQSSISFPPLKVERYKKITIWGFSIFLILLAKLNYNEANKIFVVIVCGLALLLLFMNGRHDSSN